MSRHDPLVRVRHMRDYSQEAIDLLGDKSLEELHADRVLQLALAQLIEIVGEASKQVGADFRQAHPELPWSKAAGMRDRLIHGYDLIDIAIVYKTVKENLPALIQQIEQLIQ
jgi:uncharacterized protein with HEPN domain